MKFKLYVFMKSLIGTVLILSIYLYLNDISTFLEYILKAFL